MSNHESLPMSPSPPNSPLPEVDHSKCLKDKCEEEHEVLETSWFSGKNPSIIAGPLIAGIVMVLMLLSEWEFAQAATVFGGVWMAIWWVSEALPVAATSLLPIVLFPLTGALDSATVAANYGHPLVYLFLGNFLVALAVEKWGLNRRIALAVLLKIGTTPRRVLAGVMLVTSVLSMFISNTATSALMLPIALSLANGGRTAPPEPASKEHSELKTAAAVVKPQHNKFAKALLFGVAYSASIGGMGTLIGSAPNVFVASFIEETFDTEVGFALWMVIGLPTAITLWIPTWYILTRKFELSSEASISKKGLEEQYEKLGPMSRAEKGTATIFSLAVLLWLTRPFISDLSFGTNGTPLSGLSDSGIAVATALMLFILPADKQGTPIMDWPTAKKLPWGVLLLFGGGLAFANAITASGIVAELANIFGRSGGGPLWLVQLGLIVVIVFMTELASNTATTVSFAPIISALASGWGLNPAHLLLPIALAATCAFMMPVATPPNAIVFSSGMMTIREMIKTGFVVNLVAIVVIWLSSFFWVTLWIE